MLEVQRTSDTMEPRYIETTKWILQLNEWFSLQCYYTMYAIRPQYFRSPLVRAVFCEDVIKRRSVTSRYHGGKISRSQQSFLTETAICVVERRKKSLGYRFAPECNHAQESHTCQCCPRICGTTVCWGPDIMLPWQRDVRTSPLYRPFARWRHFTATTRILFVFPFIFKFCNPSEVWITKALICTRKQNPEGFWS